MKNKMVDIVYLGDGVYVKFDGYHIILTANNPTTDTIYLDPHVVNTLIDYIETLRIVE